MENVLVATNNQAQAHSPMDIANQFLKSGGDIANLEKMLALQEKYDAMQAKKAFTAAMAKFKSTPLFITKDKFNSHFKSKYTSIGNLVNTALPRMGECGLSHKWVIEQPDPKMVQITCVVTHSDGHSESVVMAAPPDTSGGSSKNPIQQIKSTVTYLKSATFESIMGLASSDANLDDDGNGAGVKTITPPQVESIKNALEDTDSDEQAFLAWIGADSIENIPAEKFILAITSIKKKAEKNALHKTDAWRKWTEAKENCPDIAGGLPEPATEQQCIEATRHIIQKADEAANGEA
jgi:hypothetical protein